MKALCSGIESFTTVTTVTAVVSRHVTTVTAEVSRDDHACRGGLMRGKVENRMIDAFVKTDS